MSAASGDHSLARVLSTVIDSKLLELHTATPGIVVSYDPSTQTADVRPAVRPALPDAEDEDLDVYEELPVCPHVPVAWPRGRGFSCVGTLSPGDSVLLVFCERDLSQWYETNEVSNPQFAELHALNGAIAIPGLAPRSNPIPVPSDAAALASKVDLVFRLIAQSTPPGTEPVMLALKNALVAAGYTGAPTDTVGSSIVKLGA